MSVVIVGADHLGSIEKNLYALGVKELIHITGRKRLTQNSVTIPEDTAFVLVMTDYVNHNTALSVKELAKMKEIPLNTCQAVMECCTGEIGCTRIDLLQLKKTMTGENQQLNTKTQRRQGIKSLSILASFSFGVHVYLINRVPERRAANSLPGNSSHIYHYAFNCT
jgi:hypothetical protein